MFHIRKHVYTKYLSNPDTCCDTEGMVETSQQNDVKMIKKLCFAEEQQLAMEAFVDDNISNFPQLHHYVFGVAGSV